MLPSAMRRAARGCGRHARRPPHAALLRAWVSSTPGAGEADGGSTGIKAQEEEDPELLALQRRHNLEAFKEFRKVAREFRWPNEEKPRVVGGAAAASVGDGTHDGGNHGVSTDAAVGGESAVLGTEDDFSEGAGEGGGYEESESSEHEAEPMSFRELATYADQHKDDAPDLKGRKNFDRVIRRDISERDVLTLSMFVNELGRIQPRHVTGLTAKQQRKVAKMVKRARHMGVMPHMFRLPPEFAFTSPLHDMGDIERVKAWEKARSRRD